jgi:phage-related protein
MTQARLSLLPLGDSLAGIAEDFLPRLGEVAERVIPQIADFLETRVVPAIEAGVVAVNTFIDMIEAGASPIAAMEAALLQLFGADVANRFIEIVEAGQNFIDMATTALAPITDLIDEFVSWQDVLIALGIVIGSVILSALASIVVAAAPVILVAAALIAGVALLRNAWERDWGGIQQIVMGAVEFITNAFQEGGLAGVIGALVDFVSEKIGVDLAGIFETAREFIGQAFDVIGEVVGAVLDVIGPAIAQFIDGFSSGFTSMSPVIDAFLGLWNTLQPAITLALQIAGASFAILLGVAIGVFTGIANAIKPFLTTLGIVLEGVIRFVDGVVGFFTSLVGIIYNLFAGNTEAVQMHWRNLGESVTNIVLGLIQAVAGAFIGLIATIYRLLEGFVAGVVGFFTSLYERLVGSSIVPEMVQSILDYFLSLKERGIELIQQTVQSIIDIFGNTAWGELGLEVVRGIADGLRNGAGLIADAASNAARAALDAAKGFLGISSRSKVFYEVVAGESVAGMVDRFRDARREIALAMGDMLQPGITAARSEARLVGARVGSEGVTSARPQVVIYGGLTLQGVTDGDSLLESLAELAL